MYVSTQLKALGTLTHPQNLSLQDFYWILHTLCIQYKTHARVCVISISTLFCIFPEIYQSVRKFTRVGADRITNYVCEAKFNTEKVCLQNLLRENSEIVLTI